MQTRYVILRPLSTILLLLGILVLTGGVMFAQPPLPDSLISPSFGYVVHYTNDNPYNPASPPPDADRNFFPDSQARNAINALNNSGPSSIGNPNGHHTAFTGLGFLPPRFGSPVPRTMIWNCTNCDAGNAPWDDGINLPAPQYIMQSEACIRQVMGHEAFHHVQYAHAGIASLWRWGNFAIEGTARYMQDKIYSDLDANGAVLPTRTR